MGSSIEEYQTKAGSPFLLHLRHKYKTDDFFRHCESGNVDSVKSLLGLQDLKVVDEDGWSALHYAACRGHLPVVRALLNANAAVDARTLNGQTPLHWAAREGHSDVVRVLLGDPTAQESAEHMGASKMQQAMQRGLTGTRNLFGKKQIAASVDSKDVNLRTPLHLAAWHGRTETVQILLDAKANVHQTDTYQQTALFGASCYGDMALVKILINAGINVNARDLRGRTALHCALQNGCKCNSVALGLLSANAEVDGQDSEGVTPLHWAAQMEWKTGTLVQVGLGTGSWQKPVQNSSKVVIASIIEHKANVDATDSLGQTPLHRAARNGCAEAAHALLQAGASVHAKTNDGTTALHLAIPGGHYGVVQALMNFHASPNAADQSGLTPLDWAVRHGFVEATVTLIEAKAELVNTYGGNWASGGAVDTVVALLESAKESILLAKTKDGLTPLLFAVANGHSKAFHALMCAKADFEARSPAGLTALHLACCSDRVQIVKALITAGALLNATDTAKCTALHSAVSVRQVQVVAELVTAGANLEVRDLSSRTPLHLAVGFMDILGLLLTAHANIEARDEEGRTPLHLAAECAHLPTIRALVSAKASLYTLDNKGFSPLDLSLKSALVMTALPKEEVDKAAIEGTVTDRVRDMFALVRRTKVLEYQATAAGREQGDINSSTPELVHDVFEEQKYVLYRSKWVDAGFSLTSDPYSNTPAQFVPSIEISIPDSLWTIVFSVPGIDADGWTYAHSFAALNKAVVGDNHQHWHSFVRRRKWHFTPYVGNTKVDEIVSRHKLMRPKTGLTSAGLKRTGLECSNKIGYVSRQKLMRPETGLSSTGLKRTGLECQKEEVALPVGEQTNVADTRLRMLVGGTLITAARMGDASVVRLQLSQAVDVDQTDEFGLTALHWACSEGHFDVANALLEGNASLNVRDCHGHTPTQYAEARGDHDLVSFLSAHTPTIRVLFMDGYMLEIRGSEDDHLRGLVDVRSRMGAKGQRGWVSLMETVKSGHGDVIRILAMHPGELARTSDGGRTLLHWASRAGRVDLVRQLVTAKVDIHAVTELAESCLDLAEKAGQQEVLELFAELGIQTTRLLENVTVGEVSTFPQLVGLLVTVLVGYVDVVTDAFACYVYFSREQYRFFALALSFVLLPQLVLISMQRSWWTRLMSVCQMTLLYEAYRSWVDEKESSVLKNYKVVESVLEACPSALLQLYVLLLISLQTDRAILDSSTNIVLCLSIAMSVMSISKALGSGILSAADSELMGGTSFEIKGFVVNTTFVSLMLYHVIELSFRLLSLCTLFLGLKSYGLLFVLLGLAMRSAIAFTAGKWKFYPSWVNYQTLLCRLFISMATDCYWQQTMPFFNLVTLGEAACYCLVAVSSDFYRAGSVERRESMNTLFYTTCFFGCCKYIVWFCTYGLVFKRRNRLFESQRGSPYDPVEVQKSVSLPPLALHELNAV